MHQDQLRSTKTAPPGLPVIADELVPILRRRGLYRTEYETDTLRAHLRAASPTR
jgi:hypothetical protein